LNGQTYQAEKVVVAVATTPWWIAKLILTPFLSPMILMLNVLQMVQADMKWIDESK
jgi:hypothetical protein